MSCIKRFVSTNQKIKIQKVNTRSDKKQENKVGTWLNEVRQIRSENTSSFQFTDNRPEVIAQRKLYEIVNRNAHKNLSSEFGAYSGSQSTVPIQLKGSESGVVQLNGEGKAVVDDLTNPKWQPPGKRETNAGKEAISGAELKILLRGAATAAWKTYAFHATKSSNVESITSSGLDPNRGGTGAAEGNAQFEAQSKGKVHYTRNRGLAEDYKRHFEGGTPFGRKDPNPEPAEVLKLAIPKSVADNEEKDPDSRVSDRAYRTTEAIPGNNIRSTKPKPIPPSRAHKRGKGKNQPLKPGENAEAWKDHFIRAFADTDALHSNMPTSATNILYDMMQNGLDVNVVYHILKQALQSMPASDILEFTPEDRELNPRLYQSNNIDNTGDFLPMKDI